MFKHVGKLIGSNITQKKLLEQDFFIAVITGDLETIHRLIKCGLDPNILDDDGLTALQICTEQGDLVVLKCLLCHKQVNVNKHEGTRNGDSPLMTAVAFNRNQFSAMLLQHGANPNIANNFGRTALHKAVQKKNIEMVNKLLFAKAKPNVEDAFGNTPLSWSIIEYSCKEIATILLRWGADPNYHTVRPHPLLIELALNCRSAELLDMVRLLGEHQADMNVVNPISNQSALHTTSITGYVPLADLLLKLGAIQSLRDRSGRTAYTMAVQHGQADLVAFYNERNRLVQDIIESVSMATDWSPSETAIAKKNPRSVWFSDPHATESEDEVYLQQF